MHGLPLVARVVGSDFESAIVFVPFLLLAILPDTLYFADLPIIYYCGRTGWIGGATVTAAGLNVALRLPLILPFGVSGAIVARVVGVLARSLFIVHIAGHIATKSPSKALPEKPTMG